MSKTKPIIRPFSVDLSQGGKTQQHFKDSCDVNNIIAHFRHTGIDPYAERLKTQTFGYATSQSFSDAMRNIAEINSAFAELPATERAEHQNDPANWLETLATQDSLAIDTPDAAIVPPSSTQDVETSEIVPPESKSEAD